MSIVVQYPHHAASGAPQPLSAEALWAVAAQVRRQAMAGREGFALGAEALVAVAREVRANGRALAVAWDLANPVHDEAGLPVLGVCETDPELPDTALVSVNARMVAGRPDLAASTAAHELGHVLFDVPAALGAPARRSRPAPGAPAALRPRPAPAPGGGAKGFGGALLPPPVPLHLRLLLHARAEGLRTVHAAHHGRQGSRVLAADNPSDAVAGVVAAVAGDFGVSDRFVRVRLARYRLVEGGLLP